MGSCVKAEAAAAAEEKEEEEEEEEKEEAEAAEIGDGSSGEGRGKLWIALGRLAGSEAAGVERWPAEGAAACMDMGTAGRGMVVTGSRRGG